MTTDPSYPLKLARPSAREGEVLTVLVRILERRRAFGRVDCLVTPVSGEGEIWVAETSLGER